LIDIIIIQSILTAYKRFITNYHIHLMPMTI